MPKRVSPIRFIGWTVGGLVAGFIAYLIIASRIEPQYYSRAVVGWDEPAHPRFPISKTHARLIVRNLKPRLLETSETIRNNTHIRPLGGGEAEIIVLAKTPFDARDIAREAARLYRGLAHQKSIASSTAPIPDMPGEKDDRIQDISTLSDLLSEQTREHDFTGLTQLLTEAGKNSAPALALLADEDFSRRLTRFKELSSEVGMFGVPGEPFSLPPEILVEPQIAENSITSSMFGVIAFGCLVAGAGTGVAAGFLFGRVPISPDLPALEKPSLAQQKTPPTPDPAEW